MAKKKVIKIKIEVVVKSDYRIDYQEGFTKKEKTALVTEVSAVAALQKFVNNDGIGDTKIIGVTEIPNTARLQKEIEELKAKLKECQKRKPASRKTAKAKKS